MAITEFMPGVQIEITVDGQVVKEYEDGERCEDERTVVSFIEAATGQVFAVSIKLLPEFRFKGDAVSFDIFADGTRVDRPLIRKSDPRPRVSEGHTQSDKLRKYRFADLQTIKDGPTNTLDPSKVKKLGTIEIQCDHSRIRKQSTGKGSVLSDPLGSVSEKSLKGQAISQSVRFANAVTATPNSYWMTDPVQGEPSPGAIFSFRYRSLAGLKTEGIIPRTPSPEPIERRAAQSLTTAEIEALQQSLRDMKDKETAAIKVKREKRDGDHASRKRARLRPGMTQLEFDDAGDIREGSTSTMEAGDIEIIELD